MVMLVVIWVVLVLYRGFGIGQINDGGIRMLDCAVGRGPLLMNACF